VLASSKEKYGCGHTEEAKIEVETEKREREIGAIGSCKNGISGMNESEIMFLDLQH
jgi:hypothetical protein